MLKHVYLALYFVYMVRTASGTYNWTQATTSTANPSSRYAHSSILYGEQMVMFGGYDGSNKNDVWTLNLTSYGWAEMTTSA